MRLIGVFLCLCLWLGITRAQTDVETFAPHQSLKESFIKFHVDKPVQSIQSIEIKETGKRLKSVISEDGHFVTVPDLDVKRRLVVKLTYRDGTTETIEKSPCVLFEEFAL